MILYHRINKKNGRGYRIYLKELELLAKGTPQEKEAAAFIRKTLHEIAVVYPHDPARTVNFREEVIKQILKITKK